MITKDYADHLVVRALEILQSNIAHLHSQSVELNRAGILDGSGSYSNLFRRVRDLISQLPRDLGALDQAMMVLNLSSRDDVNESQRIFIANSLLGRVGHFEKKGDWQILDDIYQREVYVPEGVRDVRKLFYVVFRENSVDVKVAIFDGNRLETH